MKVLKTDFRKVFMDTVLASRGIKLCCQECNGSAEVLDASFNDCLEKAFGVTAETVVKVAQGLLACQAVV